MAVFYFKEILIKNAQGIEKKLTEIHLFNLVNGHR